MTENDQKQLGETLRAVADQLRGTMCANEFSRLHAVVPVPALPLGQLRGSRKKAELGSDYPDSNAIGNGGKTPLSIWYAANKADVAQFEQQMRRKAHYVIKPKYLWGHIVHLAKTQDDTLLDTPQGGFKYIEEESFQIHFQGLFSEINLGSDKPGRNYPDRNAKLCVIISEIARGMALFSTDSDTLGDAYEYLIGQFAAGSGKKAGEFYTPAADLQHPLGHRHPGQSGAEGRTTPQAGQRVRFRLRLGFPVAQHAPPHDRSRRQHRAHLRAAIQHHHLQPGAHEHAAARGEGHRVRDPAPTGTSIR